MMNVCETLLDVSVFGPRASTSDLNSDSDKVRLYVLRDVQMNKLNLGSQFGAGEG